MDYKNRRGEGLRERRVGAKRRLLNYREGRNSRNKETGASAWEALEGRKRLVMGGAGVWMYGRGEKDGRKGGIGVGVLGSMDNEVLKEARVGREGMGDGCKYESGKYGRERGDG